MRFKVAAFPRDPNPYQESLYGEMRRRGVPVRYVAKLTPSLTVNLLLLPLELACLRVRGYRVFHLHWTFGFRFTPPISRGLSRRWFHVVLWVLRTLGMRIVWTAHNVLPHDPVFDDDLAARRALVRACDLVIAHSPQALSELAALGAPAPRAVVIPHGPAVMPGLDRVPPPTGAQPRTVAFVGKVLRYKGVEELLTAVSDLDVPLELIVAGACDDDRLRASLTELTDGAADRVSLRLRFHEESELLAVFAAADALVFPFRAVTTSGSVLLGLAAGRAAVIPDLPAFGHLPEAPLFRYPPGSTACARRCGPSPAPPPPSSSRRRPQRAPRPRSTRGRRSPSGRSRRSRRCSSRHPPACRDPPARGPVSGTRVLIDVTSVPSSGPAA